MLKKKIVDTARKLQFASRNMPKVWDGKSAILEMKKASYKHWRQMEWMRFYFEFLCEKHFAGILDMPGVQYGRAKFNAFREIFWDFKADSTGTLIYSVIANDAEAIGKTIDDYGHYGVILAVGEVGYDDQDRTFKKWQDQLTLGNSCPEMNKINKGAMAKSRKTEFVLSEIHFICFTTETLSQCCGSFRKGFRNALDSPRHGKVLIDIGKIPDIALVATEVF